MWARRCVKARTIGVVVALGIWPVAASAITASQSARPTNCQGIANRAFDLCTGFGIRIDDTTCRLEKDITLEECEFLSEGDGDPVVVTVNSDGSFSPAEVSIRSGQTVLWSLSKRTDAIIPVNDTRIPSTHMRRTQASIAGCQARPFDRDDPNEFTGPMPDLASGIFLLNPDEEPYTIDPALWDEAFTGVFIRLRWNEVHTGPGQFDWTVLDDQMDQAVRHGKVFSLTFKAGSKGTPDWIFDRAVTGRSLQVPALFFRDAGDSPGGGKCGKPMTLGSPANSNYREHYFDLLRNAAAHIRSKASWYRALAYIKPSGANLFSAENRLPKRCWSPTDSNLTDDSCNCTLRGPGDPETDYDCVCNPQVWAVDGEYTPEKLYEFYREQAELLTEELPDKDMSFMLIQGGWPRIANDGQYLGQDLVNADGDYVVPADPALEPQGLVGPVDQLNAILDEGNFEYGKHFVVQHNGLRPKPQFLGEPPCTQEGTHPVPEDRIDTRGPCPNQHVLEAAARNGSFTGFQTVNDLLEDTENPLTAPNGPRVPVSATRNLRLAATAAISEHDRLKNAMASTLWNAYDNTDAIFVEIYAEMFAELADDRLDGGTFKEWADRFHARRREDIFIYLAPGPQGPPVRKTWWAPDPFPYVHGHTFQYTGEGGEEQVLKYVLGTRCHEFQPPTGTITILPD